MVRLKLPLGMRDIRRRKLPWRAIKDRLSIKSLDFLPISLIQHQVRGSFDR
jgi:hypothetical protein